MFVDEGLRSMVDRMFVPPTDYDAIKVETRETPDEPILVITLFKEKQIIFYHNFELESGRLDEGRDC